MNPASEKFQHGFFIINFPGGLKKSVFLTPLLRQQKLSEVLEKYTSLRGMNMDDYVATDLNGKELSLDILIKQIPAGEVNFFVLKKGIPPPSFHIHFSSLLSYLFFSY